MPYGISCSSRYRLAPGYVPEPTRIVEGPPYWPIGRARLPVRSANPPTGTSVKALADGDVQVQVVVGPDRPDGDVVRPPQRAEDIAPGLREDDLGLRPGLCHPRVGDGELGTLDLDQGVGHHIVVGHAQYGPALQGQGLDD